MNKQLAILAISADDSIATFFVFHADIRRAGFI